MQEIGSVVLLLVVGNPVIEVRYQRFGCFDPILAVDQHRVREPELADRRGDLRHLGVVMRAAVARIRDQILDLAHDDGG